MNKKMILLSCALGLFLLPARASDDHTPLEDQMEAMNDAYKGFRRETDPVKGANEARTAQTAALKAAAEVPKMVKAMPDGPEKAKAMVAYRKMMGQLYVSLCEVEEAFLNGKIDEVANIVDSLKKQKKTGHDQFVEED